MKSLDAKLAEIKSNSASRAFILADAKDADMAFGIRAPGPRSYLSRRGERPARFSPEVWTRDEFGYRNLPEFLDVIREVVRQGAVDIMLMSAYVNEQLSIKEGLFAHSSVTPAARANDTTDVWAVRHGCYTREAAQPFRTATIDHIQCGQIECPAGSEQFPGANLGLYSCTFVNDLEQDRQTLAWFKDFREEAERKRFRYFLEVFDPNIDSGIPIEKLGEFLNDNIIRSLAGVTEAGRPLFLKIVYHGPRAMEELAQYDPNLVIGAGSGIGKEVASRLAAEGAHIACVDVKVEAAQATADEIANRYGRGIGVAGSGLSNCALAIGLACDITRRESVRAMLDQVIVAYGGFDSIIITAGIFVPPDAGGHIPDEKWALTFAVNVTGSYIVADEAGDIWREQGLPGSLVLTTSANAVVAKKGSIAYDTSKAAANHLVGELAVELSPLIRVNGVAPATVVQGSAMFPRERVIASLAKYELGFEESESTETLTSRLASFYAERTLTKSPITPADQAEAFFLLVSNRLSKTTGQIIPVDGGLSDAFLR